MYPDVADAYHADDKRTPSIQHQMYDMSATCAELLPTRQFSSQ